MISIAPVYLLYLMLIDCCICSYTHTHTKLSKTTCFLRQISSHETTCFFNRESIYNGPSNMLLVTILTPPINEEGRSQLILPKNRKRSAMPGRGDGKRNCSEERYWVPNASPRPTRCANLGMLYS
jgi:hypothetical protein